MSEVEQQYEQDDIVEILCLERNHVLVWFTDEWGVCSTCSDPKYQGEDD
jgi:hypothetical protein